LLTAFVLPPWLLSWRTTSAKLAALVSMAKQERPFGDINTTARDAANEALRALASD